MAQLFLDICLSDIPKERIKEAKNGKKYLKLNVGEMRHADPYGYDHYVSVYIPKEERGDKPVYVGKGRVANPPSNGNSPKSDDLPF